MHDVRRISVVAISYQQRQLIYLYKTTGKHYHSYSYSSRDVAATEGSSLGLRFYFTPLSSYPNILRKDHSNTNT